MRKKYYDNRPQCEIERHSIGLRREIDRQIMSQFRGFIMQQYIDWLLARKADFEVNRDNTLTISKDNYIKAVSYAYNILLRLKNIPSSLEYAANLIRTNKFSIDVLEANDGIMSSQVLGNYYAILYNAEFIINQYLLENEEKKKSTIGLKELRRYKTLFVSQRFLFGFLFGTHKANYKVKPGYKVHKMFYDHERDAFGFLIEHEKFDHVPAGEIPPALQEVTAIEILKLPNNMCPHCNELLDIEYYTDEINKFNFCYHCKGNITLQPKPDNSGEWIGVGHD